MGVFHLSADIEYFFDTSVHLTSLCSFVWCFLLIFAMYSGIGYAVAKQFLKAGDNVVICSLSGNICTMLIMKPSVIYLFIFFSPPIHEHSCRTLNKSVQDCKILTKELHFLVLAHTYIIIACRVHFSVMFRVGAS